MKTKVEWRENALIYQICLLSVLDTNGDGLGYGAFFGILDN